MHLVVLEEPLDERGELGARRSDGRLAKELADVLGLAHREARQRQHMSADEAHGLGLKLLVRHAIRTGMLWAE